MELEVVSHPVKESYYCLDLTAINSIHDMRILECGRDCIEHVGDLNIEL